MSVLWTYWIESRLQLESEIQPEGFQSTRHETAKFLRLKEGNIQESELTRNRDENGVAGTPQPALGYTVTRNAKVGKKITEIRLLQRLIEVNIVLTYVNVFVKLNKYNVRVYMEQYNFSFIGSVLLHLQYTCFLLSVMKFLLHCNHYKAYVGKPFMNPFMERLKNFFLDVALLKHGFII